MVSVMFFVKLTLLLVINIAHSTCQINDEFVGHIQIHFDSENNEYWKHDSESELMNGIFLEGRDVVHRRIRREAFEASAQVDPHAADCVEKLKTIESSVATKVVQMVITKEINDDAAFTCTFCGDPMRRSMLWFRLERVMWEGVYRINEIIPDMHDDPRLNRIYVETDHTLIIEKPTIEDAGTYFCKDHTEPDHLLKTVMSPDDIRNLLESKDKLRFLYHFDVIKPTEIPVKEVSLEIPGKAPPLDEETYPTHNFLLFTKWGQWSPCSTCGEIGTRKRLGTCAIKKMYLKMEAKPWYVDAVLNTFGSGVPCRSSVFTNHKGVSVNRPDEIESGNCNVTCIASFKNAGKLSAEGIKLQYKPKKKFSGRPILIRVKEGDPVKMKCPGVVLEDEIFWFNGTYPMKPSEFANNTRVIIHFTNQLEIKETFERDAKMYTCYFKSIPMGKFELRVVGEPYKNVKKYLRYIWYTYPFDFAVFLFLMIVKHIHRRVAIAVPEKRLRDMPSSSESGSRTPPEGPDIETYFREAHTGLLNDERGSLPSFYDDAIKESRSWSQLSTSISGSFSRSNARSASNISIHSTSPPSSTEEFSSPTTKDFSSYSRSN